MSQHFHLSTHQRLTFGWWCAAAAIVLAAALGYWGMYRDSQIAAEHAAPSGEHSADHGAPHGAASDSADDAAHGAPHAKPKGHFDPIASIYHTLQLFALHGQHVHHPLSWQSHVARFLSAGVVFWAVIRGLSALFGGGLRLAWLRCRGKHIVICGYGRLGRQLASEYRKQGEAVVVVESHPHAEGDHPLAGVSLIAGDATQADVQLRAGVLKAKQLIAVCDNVQTNIAVATTAGELVAGKKRRRKGRPLESWLFIPDAQLRQLLKRDHVFPFSGAQYRVNVRGLDVFALAARQVLRSHPLDYLPIDPASRRRVHLVLVGFGPMGQRLALQTAQLCHFANHLSPKVTVLERPGSKRVPMFVDRFREFDKLVEMSAQDYDFHQADLATPLLDLTRSNPDELVTLALCSDSASDEALAETELLRRLERDDADNVRVALSLWQTAGDDVPRTLLYQTRRRGFSTLFSAGPDDAPWRRRIHPFGSLEETCNRDVILNESLDEWARAIHNAWYFEQIKAGRKHGDKPALWPWEQIAEIYRESNRHAADHIPVKLRAARLVAAPLDSGRKDSIVSLAGPEHRATVELLAQMEHDRWCAEHRLLGYRQADGPRNDQDKTHSDLRPWDELPESSREYDRDQVRALPLILKSLDLGLYPERPSVS